MITDIDALIERLGVYANLEANDLEDCLNEAAQVITTLGDRVRELEKIAEDNDRDCIDMRYQRDAAEARIAKLEKQIRLMEDEDLKMTALLQQEDKLIAAESRIKVLEDAMRQAKNAMIAYGMVFTAKDICDAALASGKDKTDDPP